MNLIKSIVQNWTLKSNQIKERVPFIRKLTIYDLLFIILLIFSFVARLNNYVFPFEMAEGEGVRDYLIASEIIGSNPLSLNELPLFGPGNSLGLINSPIYFYLLSFFLVFYNSFFFLNLVNIIFQILTITVIYILMRDAFNGQSALLASILFSFDSIILQQSMHIWQPHIMQPFLYVSYLLIYLSWRKANINFLYSGIFFAVLAGALHNSAFAVFPTLLIICFYILWRQRRAKMFYVLFLSVFLTSFLIMYIAPFSLSYQYLRSPTPNPFWGDFINRFQLSPSQNIVNHPVRNIFNLANVFNWSSLASPYLNYLKATSVLILVALSSLMLFSQKKKQDLWLILLLGWLSLQPFIAFGLLASGGGYKTHYASLAVGTFYMFLAALFYKFSTMFKIVGKVAFVFLLSILSIYYAPLQVSISKDNLSYLQKGEQYFKEATVAIQSGVLQLKNEGNFENLNFFNPLGMKEYVENVGRLDEAMFWLALEESLGEKFVYVARSGVYERVNKLNNYAFLICVPNEREGLVKRGRYDCREQYVARGGLVNGGRLDELTSYVFSKEIYTSDLITVFVSEYLDLAE